MTLTFDGVRFGYRRPALFSDLNLTLGSGKTVLLGPNGAGKSTLMRLACGLLRPSAGTITIDGRPVSRRSAGSAGYLPQDVPVLRGLSVAEQATYFGWLAGLSPKAAKAAARGGLEQVALLDQAGKKASALSGGQLRRLGVACALTGSPSTLLLDEPTAGLDPAQRARFRGVFQSLPADLCVLVSTHQVHDILELYDQIIVLDVGRVIWQGTADQFSSKVPDTGTQKIEQAYLAMLGHEPQ